MVGTMNLRDSRVLVTGGTSGIGAELVRQLSAGGARVATCGRSQARLDQVVAETGATGWVTDLRDPTACTRLVNDAVDALDGLDILIANAGVQGSQSFDQPWTANDTTAVVDEVAINLTAPMALAGAAIPHLQASAGRFIGVTSGLAYAPKKTAPVNCATKSALHTFLDALRYQMDDDGHRVTVQEIVLPLVATPMTAGRSDGQLSAPEAAASIIRGMGTRRDRILVGKARALMAILRVAPGLGRRMLRNS
jgi:uncharacterized oxidoreductase